MSIALLIVSTLSIYLAIGLTVIKEIDTAKEEKLKWIYKCPLSVFFLAVLLWPLLIKPSLKE